MEEPFAVVTAPTHGGARRRKRAALRSAASRTIASHADPSAVPAILEASIRRQFFCCAEPAARFRVSVDELVAHLRMAGISQAPRPSRVLAHLPDVILAVACVRGDAAAWTHLLNSHAWCLDRACAEQLGASVGLAFARRFWADLRETTMRGHSGPCDAARPRTRLQSYLGLRPLRLWLADRMLGGATVNASAPAASPRPRSLDSHTESRTLRHPVVEVGDLAT